MCEKLDHELRERRQVAAELLEDVLEHGDQERDQRQQHDDREADRPASGRSSPRAPGGAARHPSRAGRRSAAALPRARRPSPPPAPSPRTAARTPSGGARARRRAAVPPRRRWRTCAASPRSFLTRSASRARQRPQDRHARGDHRRELPRRDRQILRLDPREQLDVELLGAVLVGDVDDDQAALLELIGDVLLGVRLDLAAGRHAGQVHRLEDVSRHRPTPPSAGRSTARRSAAGAPRANGPGTRRAGG